MTRSRLVVLLLTAFGVFQIVLSLALFVFWLVYGDPWQRIDLAVVVALLASPLAVPLARVLRRKQSQGNR